MNLTYYCAQDSLNGTASDSTTSLKKFSNTEVDDIFRAMERKEKQMDSIARVRAYQAYLRSLAQEKQVEGFDTSAVPYNFNQEAFVIDQHPLVNLSDCYFSARDSMKPVIYESTGAEKTKTFTEYSPEKQLLRSESYDLRPDWLLGIIIGSLVLLAWLKLFYNKFLDQTIQSIANYQLSTKLLRDQNMFSRRVAFALNINFIIVGAAFVYLILGFFQIRIFPINDFLAYLAYAGILAGMVILRFLVSHLAGHVFNRPGEFREYLHQLLLIHKSLGIYLLILVIGIAYMQENFRIYLVYISGLLIIAAFILRFGKGLKIVLNNKDVLIFYLILYLCSLEILPLLIFCRFFSLSVQVG